MERRERVRRGVGGEEGEIHFKKKLKIFNSLTNVIISRKYLPLKNRALAMCGKFVCIIALAHFA